MEGMKCNDSENVVKKEVSDNDKKRRENVSAFEFLPAAATYLPFLDKLVLV